MLIGNGFYAFSQWLTLVILAKHEIEFGEFVGVYTLALSICTPVFMLGGMELRKICASDVKSTFSSKTFYRARLYTGIAALFLIVLGSYLIYGFYDQSFFFALVSMGLLKFIESQSDIQYGNMQRHHLQKRIAISMIVKAIGQLISTFVFVRYFRSVSLGLLSTFILWSIIYFVYDRITKLEVIIEGEKKTELDIIKYAIPYGAVGGLVSVNQMIPRYLLEYFYSKALVGAFGTLAFFGKIGQIFSSAITAATITKLAEQFHDFKTGKMVKQVMIGSAIVCVPNIFLLIMAVTCGSFVLELFFNEQYAAYSGALIILIFSFIPTHISFYLQSILITLRKLKSHTTITIITLILVLSLSYFFIPEFGLEGAVYAVVIARTIQCLIFIGVFSFVVKKNREEGLRQQER